MEGGMKMEKFIALLRGINVGGKNKISMKDLKDAFLKNGFTSCATYINSGNVIFQSQISDTEKLKQKCEKIIKDTFSLDVPVYIISAAGLKKALDNAPSWWDNLEGYKHNALFVLPPVTASDVFSGTGELKNEYERAEYYSNIIFWSASLKYLSRTKYLKIVGAEVYDYLTIRNSNTVKKLASLCDLG